MLLYVSMQTIYNTVVFGAFRNIDVLFGIGCVIV